MVLFFKPKNNQHKAEFSDIGSLNKDDSLTYGSKILKKEQLEQLVSNPNQEKKVYQKIKKIITQGSDSAVLFKTIRSDDNDFWGSFLMGVTEEIQEKKGFTKEEIRKPLRIAKGKDFPYKVTADGVLEVSTNYHGKYTQEEKRGFSKKQSTTLAKVKFPYYKPIHTRLLNYLFKSTNQNFIPPAFGFDRDRRDQLVGIIFFSENMQLDPNIKINTVMQYDGGTVTRSNRFKNEGAAKAYAKNKIFNKKTNVRGSIFKSIKQLFKYGKASTYNEVLSRIKWTRNDPRCQIGIFSDNLQSRIIAQIRAIDIKINMETNFVPISFYLSDEKETDKIIFAYTLEQQEKDLKLALASENPELMVMAQIIEIYNNSLNPKTGQPALVDQRKEQILSFMKNDKITNFSKYKLLNGIFKLPLDQLKHGRTEQRTLNDKEKAVFVNHLLVDTDVCLRIMDQQNSIENPEKFMQLLYWLIENPNSINLDEINKLEKSLQTTILIVAAMFDRAAIFRQTIDIVGLGSDLLNVKYENNGSLLKLAVQNDSIEIFNELINKNVNLFGFDDEKNFYAYLFDMAFEYNSIKIVKLLLIKKMTLLDIQSRPDNNDLIIWALTNNQPEIAKLLIEEGADLDVINVKHGETALMYAIRQDQPEIAKLLIEEGADLDVRSSQHGETALMYAIRQDQPEIAKLLIEKGAGLDVRSSQHGETALMYAIRQDQPEIAKLLIEKGAGLDVSSQYGETALMYAISNNQPKIAKLLIEEGAGLDLQTHKSLETALMYSVSHNQPEIAKLLIEKRAGLDVKNANGKTISSYVYVGQDAGSFYPNQTMYDIIKKATNSSYHKKK